MNQILVAEKLYVTPELKRKKRIFKIEFFLSIFLVCILSSYYIYAEYDRDRSEQVSKELLAEVQKTTIKQTPENDDVMVIILNNDEKQKEIEKPKEDKQEEPEEIDNTYETSDGNTYSTEAIITIPKIDISYPVLAKNSEVSIDDLLEVSICKFFGGEPNEKGNYSVVGHNYRNGKMFGRLSELVNGDIVELEDLSGRTLKYEVYDKYVVYPEDTSCTNTRTNREELTLITCTNYGTQRLVVKCKAI